MIGGLQMANSIPESQDKAAFLKVRNRGIHPDPIQLWIHSRIELAGWVEEDHVDMHGQLGHPHVVGGQVLGHTEDILSIRLHVFLALQLLKSPRPTRMHLQKKLALFVQHRLSTSDHAISIHQEVLPLMPN